MLRLAVYNSCVHFLLYTIDITRLQEIRLSKLHWKLKKNSYLFTLDIGISSINKQYQIKQKSQLIYRVRSEFHSLNDLSLQCMHESIKLATYCPKKKLNIARAIRIKSVSISPDAKSNVNILSERMQPAARPNINTKRIFPRHGGRQHFAPQTRFIFISMKKLPGCCRKNPGRPYCQECFFFSFLPPAQRGNIHSLILSLAEAGREKASMDDGKVKWT